MTTTSTADCAGLGGAELATAFEGKLERTSPSLGYHIGILLVAMMMVLLPLVYLATIAAAAIGVWWYATHAVEMFSYVRGRAIIILLIAYLAPIIAGTVLVVFMILPMFWRSARGPRPFWINRREQPLFYAYVDKLCEAMHVPRPDRIDVTAAANASAHIDNGLLGLFHRRLVLTIGLPLVNTMTLRQFTGVLAHEFGHFAQGSSMRLSYLVGSINAWFVRMAWDRSGIDDLLDEQYEDAPHWTIAVVVPMCKLVLGVVRVILRCMAILSHLLIRLHLRQAEYDADRRAARIVGSVAMEDGLQMSPFLAAASDVAIKLAQESWQRGSLPDDLVLLTDRVYLQMPEEVKQRITNRVLTAEASWFDTHPPTFKRIAALRRADLQGVLKLQAPATVLFRNYDDLCKLATLDFYQGILGSILQPEHLHPVK